jgi:hypothetical protein
MNKPPLPKGMRWMTEEEIASRKQRNEDTFGGLKFEKSIWRWMAYAEWDRTGWIGTSPDRPYCTNKPKNYWLTH